MLTIISGVLQLIAISVPLWAEERLEKSNILMYTTEDGITKSAISRHINIFFQKVSWWWKQLLQNLQRFKEKVGKRENKHEFIRENRKTISGNAGSGEGCMGYISGKAAF